MMYVQTPERPWVQQYEAFASKKATSASPSPSNSYQKGMRKEKLLIRTIHDSPPSACLAHHCDEG